MDLTSERYDSDEEKETPALQCRLQTNDAHYGTERLLGPPRTTEDGDETSIEAPSERGGQGIVRAAEGNAESEGPHNARRTFSSRGRNGDKEKKVFVSDSRRLHEKEKADWLQAETSFSSLKDRTSSSAFQAVFDEGAGEGGGGEARVLVTTGGEKTFLHEAHRREAVAMQEAKRKTNSPVRQSGRVYQSSEERELAESALDRRPVREKTKRTHGRGRVDRTVEGSGRSQEADPGDSSQAICRLLLDGQREEEGAPSEDEEDERTEPTRIILKKQQRQGVGTDRGDKKTRDGGLQTSGQTEAEKTNDDSGKQLSCGALCGRAVSNKVHEREGSSPSVRELSAEHFLRRGEKSRGGRERRSPRTPEGFRVRAGRRVESTREKAEERSFYEETRQISSHTREREWKLSLARQGHHADRQEGGRSSGGESGEKEGVEEGGGEGRGGRAVEGEVKDSLEKETFLEREKDAGDGGRLLRGHHTKKRRRETRGGGEGSEERHRHVADLPETEHHRKQSSEESLVSTLGDCLRVCSLADAVSSAGSGGSGSLPVTRESSKAEVGEEERGEKRKKQRETGKTSGERRKLEDADPPARPHGEEEETEEEEDETEEDARDSKWKRLVLCLFLLIQGTVNIDNGIVPAVLGDLGRQFQATAAEQGEARLPLATTSFLRERVVPIGECGLSVFPSIRSSFPHSGPLLCPPFLSVQPTRHVALAVHPVQCD